jgi:hypothetical protein
MTSVPDPANGSGSWITAPQARPRAVAVAVMLMYVGAALEVVGIIVAIARMGNLASTLMANSSDTASQAHGIAMHDTTVSAAGCVIAICLWLFMAQSTSAGRSWVRAAAAVLFGIDTLGLLVIMIGLTPDAAVVAGLPWLIGLGATICLWRRDASQFFQQARYRQVTAG